MELSYTLIRSSLLLLILGFSSFFKNKKNNNYIINYGVCKSPSPTASSAPRESCWVFFFSSYYPILLCSWNQACLDPYYHFVSFSFLSLSQKFKYLVSEHRVVHIYLIHSTILVKENFREAGIFLFILFLFRYLMLISVRKYMVRTRICLLSL